MIALTAKMARVAHAVVKIKIEYRPFMERSGTSGRTPVYKCREGALAGL